MFRFESFGFRFCVGYLHFCLVLFSHKNLCAMNDDESTAVL